MKSFERAFFNLQRFADRWWYLPLLAGLAASDLFIMIVPMEAIIVASVLLTPRRWVRIAAWTTAGSSLGALALGSLVHAFGRAWVERTFGEALQSERWREVAAFLANWGDWALGLMAFGPLPQQPAVILVALAGMSTGLIFLSVLLGRGLKYFLFAWLGTHAPKLLKQVFPFESPLEAEALKRWQDEQTPPKPGTPPRRDG